MVTELPPFLNIYLSVTEGTLDTRARVSLGYPKLYILILSKKLRYRIFSYSLFDGTFPIAFDLLHEQSKALPFTLVNQKSNCAMYNERIKHPSTADSVNN